MRVKNILVPTDFSTHANNALNMALKIAAIYDAKIYLFHNSILLEEAELVSDIKLKEKKIVKNMEQIARQSRKENVKIYTSYESGIVHESILEQIEKNNIDLVIMGTNGARKLCDQILGSNTVKVIRSVTVPVLIIKEDFIEEDIRNILFTSNYSKELTGALQNTCDFAEQINAKLNFTEVNLDPYKILSKEMLEQKVQKLQGDSDCKAYNIVITIDEHDLCKGIQKAIDATDSQIVAMACHHKSMDPKLYNTFITEAVLYHVNKPILVLPV